MCVVLSPGEGGCCYLFTGHSMADLACVGKGESHIHADARSQQRIEWKAGLKARLDPGFCFVPPSATDFSYLLMKRRMLWEFLS